MTRTFAFVAAVVPFLGLTLDAQALSGKFRGEYICGATDNLPGLLRTPIDAIVEGDNIQFARPLYNMDGSRVVGTELAAGKIDPNGHFKLESQWALRGSIANARYSGSLTQGGGAIVGDQVWSRGGKSVSRTCVAAVVPVAKPATMKDH